MIQGYIEKNVINVILEFEATYNLGNFFGIVTYNLGQRSK